VKTGMEKTLRVPQKPRLFYGWVIVSTAVLSMMLIYGIRHSFSVFFTSILKEFHWSRGSTAFMFSLNILVYGFLAPLAGSLGDRWKPKRIMPLGILILGLATASCALATKLWHFYLLFGFLMPFGTAVSGWPLLAPALANWFVTRRGLVMGLGQMGGGLSFAYTMFTEFIISHLGWRAAFFVLAAILTVFLIPLYILFFQYRPEDKGVKPYGAPETLSPHESKPPPQPTTEPGPDSLTLGKAMGNPKLWLLIVSMFLYWGMGTYLVLAHQVKFAEDAGFSGILAASVFALFGIFMVAGQLSGGISDWIGRETTVTIANLLAIGALISLVSVTDTSRPWLLYLYAISFGWGAGLFISTIFAGAADLFHGRHFGAISGLVLTGMGIGGAIGPWLGGYIYDISGSYTRAFFLCMACFAVSAVSFWMAAPRKAARLRGLR